MSGYDLSEGVFRTVNYSEEQLWKSIRNVFSTKTQNSSSYKFVFLKSIIDCMHQYNSRTEYTFFELFEQFTKIYWIFIVKYVLAQNNSRTKETYIEQILKEYVGFANGDKKVTICFSDLTIEAKNKLVYQVIKKCKKYVVGALYGDTNELMYSFSKKKEIIQLNPQMKDFVLRHEGSIEELNYFELAKFLDKVNSRDKVNSIIKDNKYNKKDSLEAYRQLLYDEFETEYVSSDYTLQDVNTIELLIEAEKKYSQSNIAEQENLHYKEVYKKEETIN